MKTLFGINPSPVFIATVVLAGLGETGEKVEMPIDFQYKRLPGDEVNELAIKRDADLQNATDSLTRENINLDWLLKILNGWRDRETQEIKAIDREELRTLFKALPASPLIIWHRYESAISGSSLGN